MQEILKIYSAKGVLLLETPINEGCKWKLKLMEEDCITVKLSLLSAVHFGMGSHTEWNGETWVITETQDPTYNASTGGYDYELTFEHDYRLWANKTFKFTPEYGGREATWDYCGALESLCAVFLRNLQTLGFTHNGDDYVFSYPEGKGKLAKPVTFDNTSLLDSLTDIAEAYDMEWWVEGNVINLGKCDYTSKTPVEFRLGVNVEKISRSDSKATYANRIYVFGGETNIPAKYRKKLVFDVKEVTGNVISDTARPLDSSYFPDGDVDGGDITVKDGASQPKVAMGDGDTVKTAELAVSLDAGTYEIDLSRTAFYYNSIGTWYAPITYSVSVFAENSASKSDTVTLLSTSVTAETDSIDGLLPTFTATLGKSYDRLRMTVVSSCSKNSYDGGFQLYSYGIKRVGAPATASVKVTFTTGENKGKTYTATLNPNRAEGEENRIYLPSGVTAGVGDSFTIDNIVTAKVPASYFTNDIEGTMTVNGVVQKRLMLPIDADEVTSDGVVVKGAYNRIDAEEDLAVGEIVEAVVTNDDIYPRFFTKEEDGTITNGRRMTAVKKRRATVTNEETQEKETVTYWAFQDSGFSFSESYILENEKLEVVFQSGSLNGMTFEALFIEDGNGYDGDGNKYGYGDGQWFEVKRSNDYSRYLPDEYMHPTEDFEDGEGDLYVLTGWDSSYLGDTLVNAAEEELKEWAVEYIKELNVDPSTYTCVMMSDDAYGKDPDTGKPNDAYAYDKALLVGDPVELFSAAYFGTGSRVSRVIGFEKNLDLTYDTPQYIVGEKPSYSRIGELSDEVESLTLAGNAFSGLGSSSGGVGVYLITTGDTTTPTDRNAFSALRSLRTFLRNDKDDTAKHLLTFLKGFRLGEDGKWHVDADGSGKLNAVELVKAVVSELKTPDFSTGELGSGVGMYKDGDSWVMELDRLLVRKIATFLQLEIRKLSYVAGNQIIGKAGSVISDVSEVYADDGVTLEGWKCWYTQDDGTTATQNTWMAGDQARCQDFNIKEGVYENVSNKYYWRLVTEVGTDYIVLSADDHDTSTDNSLSSCVPSKGDTLVQVGYRMGVNATESDPDDELNKDRTTFIELATTGTDAPCIKLYGGVTTYELGDDKAVAVMSPSRVTFRSEYFSWTKGGVSYPQAIYRGDYDPTAEYGYYDQVTYDGGTWLCVSASSVTGETPSEDSDAWVCQVSKGEKGEGGYTLSLSGNVVEVDASHAVEGNGLLSVTATLYKNVGGGLTKPQDVEIKGWMKTADGGAWVSMNDNGEANPVELDNDYQKVYAAYISATVGGVEVARQDILIQVAAPTITAKTVKYATTDDTTRPGAESEGWSETFPTSVPDGSYLWTWTHVEYSTGDATDVYSVSRMGVDGKGIKNATVDYSQQATSVDPDTITDWGGYPSELTDGHWLYTRTRTTYSDGDPTVSYSVSQIGTGSYYAGVEEFYAPSASSDTPPTGYPSAGSYANGSTLTVNTPWAQERPTLTSAKPYLWNFEVSADSRGNRYVTSPRCIGNFAKGIASIVETYAISAYAKAEDSYGYPTDIAAADWTDEHSDAAPTDERPYQWNWTRTTYNDGTSDDFYHVSAVKGTAGADTVRLDLDNENDSMLYDGQGKLVSGSVTSNAKLYKGTSDVSSSATFNCVGVGCTATMSGGKVTVTAMSAATSSVTVQALYGGNAYTSILTLKKLVGVDKYEIALSANAVHVDSAQSVTPESVTVGVYRTSQNGSRTLLSSLPTGYSLKNGGTKMTYSSGEAAFAPSSSADSYTITLSDASGNTLDSETVPVVRDGEAGPSAAYVSIAPSTVYVPCDSDGKPTDDTFDTPVFGRLYADGVEGNVTAVTVLNEDGAGQSWESHVVADDDFTDGFTVDVTFSGNATGGQEMYEDVLGHSFILKVDGTVDGVEHTVYTPISVVARMDGEKGEDAVELFLNPDTLDFETDGEGELTAASKSVAVKMRKAAKTVTAAITSLAAVGCTAGGTGGGTLTVAPTKGTTLEYQYYDSDGEVRTGTRPVYPTAGSVTVTAKASIDGVSYTRTGSLRFAVDYKELYETFSTENDQFISKFGELATDSQCKYKELYTELRQTKGTIGMKVYNQYAEAKATDGKNLIPDSYVRYYGSSSLTPTERSMTLEAGKTYTLSARGMVNSTMLAEATINRMAVYVYADGWKESHRVLFSSTSLLTKEVTFTAANGGTWYAYATPTDSSGSASALPSQADSRGYVEWMQLEEGGSGTDWQACIEDAAANEPLCRRWTAAGKTRAERPDGTQGEVAYCDNSAGTSYVNLLYKDSGFSVASDRTYTLSFYAKGSGTLHALLYNKDGEDVCFGSVMDGLFLTSADGWNHTELTDAWTFHEVTFSVRYEWGDGEVSALLRADAGCTAYVCDWKLEENGKATRGLADNLLPTGFDIYDGVFEATADNFAIRNNSGETTMTVDENGYLTAAKLAASSDGARVEVGVYDGKPVLRGFYKDGSLAWEFNGSLVTIGDIVKLTVMTDKSKATYSIMTVNGTNTLSVSFTVVVSAKNNTGSPVTYNASVATCTVTFADKTVELTLATEKTVASSDTAEVTYKGSETYTSTDQAFANPTACYVTVKGTGSFEGGTASVAFTNINK